MRSNIYRSPWAIAAKTSSLGDRVGHLTAAADNFTRLKPRASLRVTPCRA
jgi:hypothetical protein